MKIAKKYEFPQHVDDIYHAYISEAFIVNKIKALGGRNIEVQIEKGEDQVKVYITREMAAEVPGPLKKFAKPWNRMTQTEVWQGSAGGPYHAQMTIEIADVPVSISGKMKLEASEDGAVAFNQTEIKSGIPFLGKMVSKFVAEASENAIEDEMDYVRKNA